MLRSSLFVTDFLLQADSITFGFVKAMNLVIDSGNSAAKVGIFDQQKLHQKLTFVDFEELRRFLKINSFENILVSSVKTHSHEIASWATGAERVVALSSETALPITNLYMTPHSLGMDRLAGVCGAVQLFPAFDNLVIDAGTCITYDFIDQTAQYHGGSISPGLNMRFKAVHTFTAKLPLVSAKASVDLIGKTTEAAIQSGVVNGLLAEIEGTIERYKAKFPGLKVILCGGDAGFFENQLKATIFAVPDLVLFGLNSILIHNVNRS